MGRFANLPPVQMNADRKRPIADIPSWRHEVGMVHQLQCLICSRPLGVQCDPLSGDCGGDCWGCIGQIEGGMGGDPSENISIGFVAKEIGWGWRDIDGTPKPQSFFLQGGPHYIKVRWASSSPDNPAVLWSELDEHRKEIRKIEIWHDGRTGYAFEKIEVSGTRLGECPVPQLDEIAADPQFEPEAITQADFEAQWAASVC